MNYTNSSKNTCIVELTKIRNQENITVECVLGNRMVSVPTTRCRSHGGLQINKFEQVSSDQYQMLLSCLSKTEFTL